MTKIFLVVYTLTSTSSAWFPHNYPFSSMEACYESIRMSRTFIPQGGDAEAGLFMMCVEELPED